MSIHRPATRAEFKAYVLRSLGDGAVVINVTDDQVEDAIEFALQYYTDFHYDGSHKEYLKHQITPTDVTNGYITVNPDVIGIVAVMDPIGSMIPTSGMFSPQYQIMWQSVNSLSSVSIAPYFMAMQHVNLINQVLRGSIPYRFNRHVNKLFLDTNWEKFTAGNWILAECHVRTDPDVYPDVWNDRWLQQYTAARIKRAWGSNMSKFEGVQLLGGVTMNGAKFFDDANAEIQQLEDEMQMKYTYPPLDQIG